MKRLSFVLSAVTSFVAAQVRTSSVAIASTAQNTTSLARTLIATFDKDFNGPHSGSRPNHAKGFLCKARFVPSPEAATLSRAAHFHAPTEALVRFSDFGGYPNVPDDSPGASPYGMSVKFLLPDGGDTDIVGHSTPFFPASNAKEFNNFLEALGGGGSAMASYIATRPAAAQFVKSLRPAPVSYATLSYFYINAFRFVDAKGEERNVRYSMQALEIEAYLSATAAKSAGADYLRPEFAGRLKAGPVRFDYIAQIAEASDITSDPTAYWPAQRRHVGLGTLTIGSVVADSDDVQRKTLFDPGNLTDGIAFSDDPMVAVRSQVYNLTFARRNS
jgi:catalase